MLDAIRNGNKGGLKSAKERKLNAKKKEREGEISILTFEFPWGVAVFSFLSTHNYLFFRAGGGLI